MSIGLQEKLTYLYPAANPATDWILAEDANGQYISYWNPALGPQPTQAELDAVTEAVYTAWLISRFAQAEKARATTTVDNGGGIGAVSLERVVRCLALTILDEFNRHATRLNLLKNEIAAATSLTDVKNRMLAIADYAEVTPTQLVNAIKAQIASTPE